MQKMNITDNQMAFEYVLYMIASSYFDKAECRNRILEKKMLLRYKEQKTDKQYQMENICIDFMERLSRRLPDRVFRRKIQIHLRLETDGSVTILCVGGTFVLEFFGVYAGRHSRPDCRLWVRRTHAEKEKAV